MGRRVRCVGVREGGGPGRAGRMGLAAGLRGSGGAGTVRRSKEGCACVSGAAASPEGAGAAGRWAACQQVALRHAPQLIQGLEPRHAALRRRGGGRGDVGGEKSARADFTALLWLARPPPPSPPAETLSTRPRAEATRYLLQAQGALPLAGARRRSRLVTRGPPGVCGRGLWSHWALPGAAWGESPRRVGCAERGAESSRRQRGRPSACAAAGCASL